MTAGVEMLHKLFYHHHICKKTVSEELTLQLTKLGICNKVTIPSTYHPYRVAKPKALFVE